MLELDRIGKTYPNGTHALDSISIEVATAPLLRWQDAFGRQGGAA